MAQPYNYMLPQANPLESVTSGLQLGATLGQLAQQKEEADLLKAKRERAALFQTDMASFLTDPTPRKSIDLIKKYPEYVEKIQAGRKAGEEAEDRAEFDLVKNMFVAANNGNLDYAKGLMQKHIDVLKSEGKDASEFEPILNAFDSGNANKVIGYLSSQAAALYPDEWIKTSEAMEKSKQEQAKSAKFLSEAKEAASKAKFSDSILASQLAKSNWDIKKLQSDIDVAQQNKRIAAMEAVYKRETDDLRRQELQGKIDLAKEQRESTLKTKAAEGEAALLIADNTLNTIDKILKNKSWKDVVGSFEGGQYTGPLLTGLDEKEQEAIRDIETLGSQIFLNQVRQFGSTVGLTEKEGDKIQASLQSLSRAQSESAFKNNLLTIKAIVEKGRQNTLNKYGMPDRPIEQFLPQEKKKATSKGAMAPTQNMLEADRILSGGR